MSNITLNPGAGGSTVATDIHGGDHYQINKVAGNRVSQWPNYDGPSDTFPSPLNIDDYGSLQTRGAVLTDEGTFRVNFSNTSLFLSLGAVTVAGDVVTGTGFAAADVHVNDYFKVAADADTACVQIDSIDSDTQITLKATYVGSASGTGNRALVQPYAGTGGSWAVGSGALTLTAGTTAAAVTGVRRYTDYGPLVYRSRVTASQRIANQTIYAGLREDAAVPRWFARFNLDGTVNTAVKCETGRNPSGAPSASETQTTTVTLPNGATTATVRDMRVELLTESVRFFVDGVLMAEHSNVIPHQHDEMTSCVEIVNGTTPATSTTVTVDYLTGKNHNKLEIGVMSDAEKIVASAAPLVPYSYSQAGVIAINTDLLVLDCSQLRSLFIQCDAMGTTGVVTVQWSNTPAFTVPVTATLLSEAGATSTTFNAAVLRITNVMARYCRLRLTTATTAGTTTINVWGSQNPYVPLTPVVTVAGTAAVSLATNTPTLAAGTNLAGDVGLQVRANATGAASTSHLVSAATTNAGNVKAGAGRLLGWSAVNTTASYQYVKLHNTAGAPTAGAGVVQTIAIPPNGVNNCPPTLPGIAFTTGIGRSIVTGSADADATATTAGSVVLDLFFA